VRRIDPETTFAQGVTRPVASIEKGTIASRDDRDADFGRSASIPSRFKHSYCIETTIKFVCLAYQLVGYGTDRCDGRVRRQKPPVLDLFGSRYAMSGTSPASIWCQAEGIQNCNEQVLVGQGNEGIGMRSYAWREPTQSVGRFHAHLVITNDGWDARNHEKR
jgi:hypothetical protein